MMRQFLSLNLTSSGLEPNFKFMVLRGQRAAVALSQTLRGYYARLLYELGPQGWWPARARLEVVVGTVLTQNTSWQNAAEALKRLRQARRLSLPGLRRASQSELEPLVRPAGFFRQKALAIRRFLDYLERSHQGSLPRLLARPAEELRPAQGTADREQVTGSVLCDL
jgi:endonuclease III related protein